MRSLLPLLKLYRHHWFSLSLGIILAIATLASAIGLLTLSGWFIAASAVAGLSPVLLKTFNYMLPAGGVRGLSMSRTAGRWGERVVSHDATFRLLARLRVHFFSQLAPLMPSRNKTLRQGDLLNRLVADVDAMDQVYLRLVSPLIAGVIVIGLLTLFISAFDPRLGVTLGGILLALMLILPIIFYQLGKSAGVDLTLEKANYRIKLLDWLQCHSELVIFGAESRYQSQLTEHQQKLFNAQRKMASITGFATATLVLFNGWTLIFMLWLASDGVAGNVPDPKIAMITFATLASFELMAPVAGAFQYLSQTLTSARRLNEITEAKPDVEFVQDKQQKSAQGSIQIENVSFSYDDQHQVLNQISLTVEQGSKIALLGKTGCGKSTLLQLLTRSWDPQQGAISIDHRPLTAWSEKALRDSISVVSQRVDLFNDSLRENLLLASPSANDQQLEIVLTEVGLAHLLSDEGLSAWIGDGGRQLSGGERRRIGIARAILHDAPILLMDEPTEGLDQQTEVEILQLLTRHAQKTDHRQAKTVLYITHRLVGLTSMDQIYVMESGQIVEFGSHHDLIDQQGRYAQLQQSI
ncbi:cysteine/glutathione ABC transporter ATP-binding protein/permease CydC [Vibrio sp. SS-MA-C1-2]|uniref:heme ABC transporter ATP-binding protein/permease CydC n=1 Tax=Vibrio sp. SS-MA-C1-2 TaxID=2908646 RepID=UPI001F286C53|nr:cysteine/glutathione ABC transporter ATP-binding protein/permease CydC [Vibrio sp. SS-MA-C1-2]UJF19886.1 cysteine/glutathione ABC transporter ATP-binding protein/permease CydC [Vibrio sp. SS-MA-C1-2]